MPDGLAMLVPPIRSAGIVTPRYLYSLTLGISLLVDAGGALPSDWKDATFLYIKIHEPVLGPDRQKLYVLQQFEVVIFSHNLSVDSTVVSKQADGGLDVIFYVINKQQEKGWTDDRSLGNSWCYSSPWGLSSINNFITTACFLSVRKDMIQLSESPEIP